MENNRKYNVIEILEMSDKKLLEQVKAQSTKINNLKKKEASNNILFQTCIILSTIFMVGFTLLAIASLIGNTIIAKLGGDFNLTIPQKLTVAFVLIGASYVFYKTRSILKFKMSTESSDADEVGDTTYLKLALISEIDETLKEECKKIYANKGMITNEDFRALYQSVIARPESLSKECLIIEKIKLEEAKKSLTN